MATSLIRPMAASINAISRKIVTRARKRQEGGFFPILALPLLMKALGKVFTTAGKDCNNKMHMDKNVQISHSLSNIEITKYFNYIPKFNGVFSKVNLHRIEDGVYLINLDDKQSKRTH